MKFYKSVVFGVSMMAVASGHAVIYELSEEEKTLTKEAVLLAAKFQSDQGNLGNKAMLVQNILNHSVYSTEEKHKLVAGLYIKDGVTDKMVKDALEDSNIQGFFSYNKFCGALANHIEKHIEVLEKHSLFRENYLPLDMLNLIFQGANNYQITQLLLGVDSAHSRTESWIKSWKDQNSSLSMSSPPPPELPASYFEAELEKISKTVPKNDRPSKYQECIELLSSLKIDEPSKIRILATRSPKTLEFIEALVSIKCIDEPSKIRIFATKYITDPEFAEIVEEDKNNFSKELQEFVTNATPETVPIDMTLDLDEQLKKLTSPRFEVKIKNFDKNKIEKLLKNKNILSLNLWNENIGDEGALALAPALEKNKTLLFLNLRGNNIRVDGAKFIGQALEKNKTLLNLNLGENYIGDEGALALAPALEKNTTLKKLNLMYNNIGDEGAKALAKSLENNSTLLSLDLSFNNISVDGAKFIGQALEKNTTLKNLNLMYNNIGYEDALALLNDEGALALLNSLENNTTLKSLYLENNKLSEDVKSQFRKWAGEKGIDLDI